MERSMRTRPWAIISGKNGRAVIEYALLIIIILAALFWMKGPIVRAFYGRWKATGDSFAFGRQYDPKRTVECAYDTASRLWYDERCFDNGRRACDALTDEVAVALCEANVIRQCSNNCGDANSNPSY